MVAVVRRESPARRAAESRKAQGVCARREIGDRVRIEVGGCASMPHEWPNSLLAKRGVTRREAEVFAAVAERMTNASIAERLYLSERTVESHVSSLLRKLGAANRVELGDLAKEIEYTELGSCTPSPLPAPLALLADAGTFVGRTREMDQLRALWRLAQADRLLLGVVSGDAGIGKSRLVAELADEVRRDGSRVLLGSCSEDLRTPYEPFIEAVSTDVATFSKPDGRRQMADPADRLTWL